jgi:hypothetical protein
VGPFHSLPREIVTQILKSCCDFTSLDGLLQISSKATKTFDIYYVTITEAVLSSCPMTQGINGHKFRLVVAMEPATIGPGTSRRCLEDIHWNPMPPAIQPLFQSLDSAAPIRQAIKSAAKVHRLACVCYDTLIENIKKDKPARLTAGSDRSVMYGLTR